ncbi:MAG: hypothetical protein MJZ63_00745 [Muribaculaceae bacterium]|nr:hypothetical protein [Muribaculaceae bacterium]
MRIKALIISLLISVIAHSAIAGVPKDTEILPGIDEATMKAKFAEMDLQHMEGIWEYPNEQMKLAIERYQGEKNIAYRIILLASTDLELLPGTVVGYIAPSADPKKCQLWMYTERSKVGLQSPMECVATLSADGTSLTFDPPHYKVKVRLNLVRFFTKIFRGVSVIPEKVEEKLPVGFRKVYPANGNGEKFNEIRYL